MNSAPALPWFCKPSVSVGRDYAPYFIRYSVTVIEFEAFSPTFVQGKTGPFEMTIARKPTR